MTHAPLVAGSKVRLVKVADLQPLGPDYSYSVRVSLKLLNGFRSGETVVFFARHPNRLSDPIVRLNDGIPSHTIELQRA